MSYEVETTRRGYRLNQNGSVLSEVLAAPGATNSVFDFLAGLTVIFAGQGDAALLGFAGGGMIAPLRKAGAGTRIYGVDLDLAGHELFRRVSQDWCGEVSFEREDAVTWLERREIPFHVVIEDLSVPTEDDVIKPDVSCGPLPELIRAKLRPGGVVVTNMLKPKRMKWDDFMPGFARGHRSACVVHLREFENRIMVAGDFACSVRQLSRRLGKVWRDIGSDQADQFSLRTFR